MENRLSQQKGSLVPTRELPVRKLHLQKGPRGFHETIGIAARRYSSGPSDSEEDDGRSSPSNSQVSVAADGRTSPPNSQASVVAAVSTLKPRGRGRPRKKQKKTTEKSEKPQVSRATSQGPPSAKKRRGRQPKATQLPTPPVHVSRTLRNNIRTQATNAADSSAREGERDTTENLEGREEKAASLKSLFEHVWLTYYASIDGMSVDQMESALNIFVERAINTNDGDE